MTILMAVSITERPDGIIEVQSEVTNRHELGDKTEVSANMGEMCKCVGAGLRAGLEAFAHSNPGRMIIQTHS
jgi:hypothetical protein